MISRYDIGMRTLVDLPEKDIRALDARARIEQVSRAELVRRAVAGFLERQHRLPEEAFGAWGSAEDGLRYQRRLRDEW